MPYTLICKPPARSNHKRLLWLLFPVTCLFSLPISAGEIQLASNAQVLALFGQVTSTQTPELIAREDGGTRIEWRGSITNDFYNVRAKGGSLVNPTSDGDFHRLQLVGDLRGITPDNRTTYLQVTGTHTDDMALQSNQNMVNSFQTGHFSDTYQVAFGDVNADFSTLGTRTGIRGLFGATRVGELSVLSFMAGTIAPTWNAVADKDQRSEYLRNAFSAKFETPLSSTTSAYFTAQGFADDPSTLSSANKNLAPVSGRTATAGLNYREGRLALGAEVGISHWSPDGQDDETTHAFIADGSWTEENYTINWGHHDFGTYYTSLSAEAQPGIMETYLAGNWRTSSWLLLQGDLRHSRNKAADSFGSVTAVTTNSATLIENISFGEGWPGLGLALSQSISDGKNEDGSDNRQLGYGTSLSYGDQQWNGSLGFNRSRLRNDGSPAYDGSTDTWSVQLGRSFMDNPANPTWLLSLGLSASLQDQELDSGDSTRTEQLGFTLAASRSGWGTLSAGYNIGWIEPTTGGPDLKNRGYYLEAAHPFKGDKGSVKLYLQNADNASGDKTLENETQTAGIQLELVF